MEETSTTNQKYQPLRFLWRPHARKTCSESLEKIVGLSLSKLSFKVAPAIITCFHKVVIYLQKAVIC